MYAVLLDSSRIYCTLSQLYCYSETKKGTLLNQLQIRIWSNIIFYSQRFRSLLWNVYLRELFWSVDSAGSTPASAQSTRYWLVPFHYSINQHHVIQIICIEDTTLSSSRLDLSCSSLLSFLIANLSCSVMVPFNTINPEPLFAHAELSLARFTMLTRTVTPTLRSGSTNQDL
jgi:hypothetical protein